MQKGIDYTGICIAFFCHDGQGNYLFHRRTDKCRDEVGRFDCGGGGLQYGESLSEAVQRELQEEYGVKAKEIELLGFHHALRETPKGESHWLIFDYKILVDRNSVKNMEPYKHELLSWYKIDRLPSPLHSQIPKELEMYKGKL